MKLMYEPGIAGEFWMIEAYKRLAGKVEARFLDGILSEDLYDYFMDMDVL